MKTIFFTPSGSGRAKQVFMQSACSGGTGTFIEKTARKLQVAGERLAEMPYAASASTRSAANAASSRRRTPTRWSRPACRSRRSSRACSRPWSTRTSPPSPRATRHARGAAARRAEPVLRRPPGGVAPSPRRLWEQRKVELPAGRDAASLIVVPDDALYYACLGCVELARGEGAGAARTRAGTGSAGGSRKASRTKGKGARGPRRGHRRPRRASWPSTGRARRGRDGGGAGAHGAGAGRLRLRQHDGQGRGALARRASCSSPATRCRGEPHRGRPGAVPAGARGRVHRVAGLALTGYGKDLLKDVLGADVAVVETVAHATGALHFYPDADVICDVAAPTSRS